MRTSSKTGSTAVRYKSICLALGGKTRSKVNVLVVLALLPLMSCFTITSRFCWQHSTTDGEPSLISFPFRGLRCKACSTGQTWKRLGTSACSAIFIAPGGGGPPQHPHSPYFRPKYTIFGHTLFQTWLSTDPVMWQFRQLQIGFTRTYSVRPDSGSPSSTFVPWNIWHPMVGSFQCKIFRQMFRKQLRWNMSAEYFYFYRLLLR